MLPLILLAFVHHAHARCFETGRAGCWDRGFVDHLSSASACQLACLFRDCEYFDYNPSRGDRRCHLCSGPRRTACTIGHADCVWGPALCPGETEDAPERLLLDAVDIFKGFCAGKPTDPEAAFEASLGLHAVVSEFAYGETDANFSAAVPSAAADASAALETCPRADPCTYVAALNSNIRAFLLVRDENAVRAFVDDPERRVLFDDHSIFLADNGHFNAETFNAFYGIFDTLPASLMTDGVLYDAPFATLTARDAFRCNSDQGPSGILSVTRRSFNVFATRVGARSEDAFGGTTRSLRVDQLLSVARHEVAHQFDRARSERLKALFHKIKSLAGLDDDWLRAGVGNEYFQRYSQEIIASQMGNQYMISTSTQLLVAEDQAKRGNYLPLAWFLFHIELIAGGADWARWYEVDLDWPVGADVEVFNVSLARGGDGRVEAMTVPGCGTYEFSYDTNLVAGYTYDGRTPCRPRPPSTASPTLSPTLAPAIAPRPPPETAAPTPSPETAMPTYTAAPTPETDGAKRHLPRLAWMLLLLASM